jgi:hypothetical protein
VLGFKGRGFGDRYVVEQFGGFVIDGRSLRPIHEPGKGVNDQDDSHNDAGDNLSDGQGLVFFSHIWVHGVEIEVKHSILL